MRISFCREVAGAHGAGDGGAECIASWGSRARLRRRQSLCGRVLEFELCILYHCIVVSMRSTKNLYSRKSYLFASPRPCMLQAMRVLPSLIMTMMIRGDVLEPSKFALADHVRARDCSSWSSRSSCLVCIAGVGSRTKAGPRRNDKS